MYKILLILHIMSTGPVFQIITSGGRADRLKMVEELIQERMIYANDNIILRIIIIGKRLNALNEQLKYDLLDRRAMIESIMDFITIKKRMVTFE